MWSSDEGIEFYWRSAQVCYWPEYWLPVLQLLGLLTQFIRANADMVAEYGHNHLLHNFFHLTAQYLIHVNDMKYRQRL